MKSIRIKSLIDAGSSVFETNLCKACPEKCFLNSSLQRSCRDFGLNNSSSNLDLITFLNGVSAPPELNLSTLNCLERTNLSFLRS